MSSLGKYGCLCICAYILDMLQMHIHSQSLSTYVAIIINSNFQKSESIFQECEEMFKTIKKNMWTYGTW